jgi:cytochrome P450
MNDGPSHQALRPAAASLLEPLDESRVTAASQEWAQRLTAEIASAASPRQISDLTFRLPVYVMGDLLGVSGEQLPALARWTGDFVAAIAPGSLAAQVDAGKEAADHLLGLFRSLHAGSDDDLTANRIGFLVQAHDATAGLIGNALLALAARPEIRRQTSGDPGLLRPFLLEVLRFDPSIQNTRRFVAEDGLVASCSMHAGDAVLVLLAAANRDPVANPEPDRFDPLRQNRRLFTFGLGAHACLGETMAVAIAQAGVESLLESGLDLETLAGSFTYRPSVNARIPLFG